MAQEAFPIAGAALAPISFLSYVLRFVHIFGSRDYEETEVWALDDCMTLEKVTLQVNGMTCGACALRIEKGLGKLNGIDTAFVNLPLGAAYLRYNPSMIKLPQIIERIKQLGFSVSSNDQDESAAESGQGEIRTYRNRFLGSFLLTLPLLWPMLHHFNWTREWGVPEWSMSPWLQLLLATVIQLIWGTPFLIGAYRALRSGYANMDVLIALGTNSAYFYSHYLLFHPIENATHPLYFETSAVIISVVWLGKWLEAQSRRRVQAAMKLKMSVLPQAARIVTPEGVVEIAAAQLQSGDTIVIRTGELIPADGIILQGTAMADESAISGESRPLEKAAGGRVSAGSRLISGELAVKAERTGIRTALGQMIRALEEAQSEKTALQLYADRAAAWFVPVVIGLALAAWGYWYWLGYPGELGRSIQIAIAVVVSACPCAIGLASPLSVFIASRRAAEHGILFRSGSAMEALAQTDVMLLDKTGTLTQGIPVVAGFISEGSSPEELLRRVASAEQQCEHPVAGAFIREAGRKKLSLTKAEDVKELTGLGVQAIVEGHRLLIGSERLLRQQGVGIQLHEAMKQWDAQGCTVMHIAVNGKWAGAAAVSDTLRRGAAGTVSCLRRNGMQIILGSGDGQSPVAYAGIQAGLEDVRFGLLPQDKLNIVQEFASRGRKVVVVGDGVNDSAAMAASHCSITVPGATAAAKEAADVHVLRDEFTAVGTAIQISKLAVRNMKQNLGWSLAYNMLIVPAAMAGQLDPWAAGAAMTGSSLTVVLNALRLDVKLRKLGI